MLVGIFGVYCLLDGALLMAVSVSVLLPRGRGWLLLASLVSIGAGIVTLARPADAAVVILLVVALRAMIVGLTEVIAAMRLGYLTFGRTGLLSIAFGILLVRNPSAGLLSAVWTVGIYGIVVGGAQIVAARAIGKSFKEPPATATRAP